jgi:hypothetical protein
MERSQKVKILETVKKVVNLVLPLFIKKGLEKAILIVNLLFDFIKRAFL